jgi:hypothetical protein
MRVFILCVCVCVCVSVCVSRLCVYVHVYVCVCVCIHVCVYIYVDVCVCMFMSVCARVLVRVRDGTCFYETTQCVFAVFVLCASCAGFCFLSRQNRGVMLLALHLDKATTISLVPYVNEILS